MVCPSLFLFLLRQNNNLLPVGLEPTASELEVRRAAIAPRELTKIGQNDQVDHCP